MVAAEVGAHERVQVGHRAGGRIVQIGAGEPADPVTVAPQGRAHATAGVQHVWCPAVRQGAGFEVGEGLVEKGGAKVREGGSRTGDFEEAGLHQAVAVAASAMPCDSSQRSASMAALQPSPAAVTA